jgi:hypothetical protein
VFTGLLAESNMKRLSWPWDFDYRRLNQSVHETLRLAFFYINWIAKLRRPTVRLEKTLETYGSHTVTDREQSAGSPLPPGLVL